MKRFISVFFLFVLIFLSGCTNKPDLPDDSPALAYWAAITALMDENSSSFSDDIIYLAFDFSNIDLQEKESLNGLAKYYCKENRYTFVEGTIDELVDRGFIKTMDLGNNDIVPSHFDNGILLSLDIVSNTENEIVADVSMWRGNLGAFGTTYTMTFEDGEWQASPGETYWVS